LPQLKQIAAGLSRARITARKGGRALLDEMRHPFLEVLGAERPRHFDVGRFPRLGERLEIGFEHLALDDADRTRRRRRDQIVGDALHARQEIVHRQSTHQAESLGFGGLDHAR
jgi:hypothetical protein